MTGYHAQAKELIDDLISHGYGELAVVVTSLKDNQVRVQINCGKSYIFYVKKEYKITDETIF